MAREWKTAVLSRVEQETAGTKRFYFKVPGEPVFDFAPGQFVTFDLPIDAKVRLRSYSIASSPAGTNEFELIIVKVEDGKGTHYIFSEEIGTEFKFIGPLGKFILPENTNTDLCFIGTGTGIAPLRSMIRYIMEKNLPYNSITLIFGSRFEADILYRKEFDDLASANPKFKFIPTLSRAGHDWNGPKGYVHDHYKHHFADGRDAQIFICGLNHMVSQCRENLAALGYSKEQIHFEKYD